jgi:hypothetical protein
MMHVAGWIGRTACRFSRQLRSALTTGADIRSQWRASLLSFGAGCGRTLSSAEGAGAEAHTPRRTYVVGRDMGSCHQDIRPRRRHRQAPHRVSDR